MTITPSSFTWDEGNKAFYTSLPTIPSGYRLAGIVATPTNGLAVLGGYYSITSNKLFVFGFVPTTGEPITSSYSGFICTLLLAKNV